MVVSPSEKGIRTQGVLLIAELCHHLLGLANCGTLLGTLIDHVSQVAILRRSARLFFSGGVVPKLLPLGSSRLTPFAL